MRTKILIVIIAVLVIVILFGIFLPKVFTGDIVEEESIKIGVVAPLTGPTAWWGAYVKQGIDLAYEELPEQERSKITLIWEDDQCSSLEGTKVVQKLIFVDNIRYIIGPLCNEVSTSTENLFEDNKVVSMTTGLPNNKIANMGKYHFSFLPEIRFLMKEMANYVYIQTLNKKIAILYLDDDFGYENYIYFKKYFEEYGGKITSEESFSKTDTDMRTQITKIKASSPDALFLIAYGPSLINILRQLEELGLGDLDKYGIHAFESPALLKEVPELAEGVVYPRPAGKTQPFSVKQYTIKYKNKYEVDNGVYSANAYDTFKILYSAIKECDDNKECVVAKLSSVKGYNGANGLLTVDERGVGSYQGVILKTVRNGEFVAYE